MQSHSYRDNYITILLDNLVDGNKNKNYRKIDSSEVSNFNTKYDFYSIMHYPPYTADGTVVIQPKQEYMYYEPFMGQRKQLSTGDIDRINNMYNCNWMSATRIIDASTTTQQSIGVNHQRPSIFIPRSTNGLNSPTEKPIHQNSASTKFASSYRPNAYIPTTTSNYSPSYGGNSYNSLQSENQYTTNRPFVEVLPKSNNPTRNTNLPNFNPSLSGFADYLNHITHQHPIRVYNQNYDQNEPQRRQYGYVPTYRPSVNVLPRSNYPTNIENSQNPNSNIPQTFNPRPLPFGGRPLPPSMWN